MKRDFVTPPDQYLIRSWKCYQINFFHRRDAEIAENYFFVWFLRLNLALVSSAIIGFIASTTPTVKDSEVKSDKTTQPCGNKIVSHFYMAALQLVHINSEIKELKIKRLNRGIHLLGTKGYSRSVKGLSFLSVLNRKDKKNYSAFSVSLWEINIKSGEVLSLPKDEAAT